MTLELLFLLGPFSAHPLLISLLPLLSSFQLGSGLLLGVLASLRRCWVLLDSFFVTPRPDFAPSSLACPSSCIRMRGLIVTDALVQVFDLPDTLAGCFLLLPFLRL